MLQYVAACCNVHSQVVDGLASDFIEDGMWQCVAVRLQCDAVCCSMLQYVAVCCRVLRRVAMCMPRL